MNSRVPGPPGGVAAVLPASLAAVVILGCAGVELARTGAPLEALEAAFAGALAVGVAALALTLRGLTGRGLVLGGAVVTTGMLSWTFMTRPLVIWAFLGAAALLFAALSWPWLPHLRRVPSLGGFWLGVAYWPLGAVGALIALRLEVAAERVVYTGVFLAVVLAVVASVRRARTADLTVGVAAAFLLAVAVLLITGSGNLVDAVNPTPAGPWGANMAHRFWGGEQLLYHPNSMALISLVVGIRVGADPAFAAYHRIAAVGLCGLVIFLTESRTAFGVAVLAGGLHGVLALRGRLRYPDRRTRWPAVALPFVVLALVLVASGGQGFLYKARYAEGDITSGRTATWAQVVDEWQAAGIGDKLLGDTKTTRAVVDRDGNQLPTDNAAFGALRRGGVLGVAAFLLGLALLLRRAVPGLLGRTPAGVDDERAAPWFAILAVVMVPAIAVTDWFLGGPGGTLWIMLLVAEATRSVATRAEAPPVPAAP